MLHPRRPRLPCTALRPLPGCTHSDELPRAVILACGSHGAWFASHTSCPHAHLSGLELEPQGRLTLPDPPAPTGRTNQKKKNAVWTHLPGRVEEEDRGVKVALSPCWGRGPAIPHQPLGGGDDRAHAPRQGPQPTSPRAQNRPETPANVNAPAQHREIQVRHQ